MVAVSAERLIDASQERVFAVATDVDRMSQWQHGVRRVRRLDAGPVRAGSRMSGERVIAGMAVRFTSVITAWDPPHRYAFRVTARGFAADGEQRVEALQAQRSRVTAHLDVRPPAAMDVAALQQRLRRKATQHLTADLAALSDLVTGQG